MAKKDKKNKGKKSAAPVFDESILEGVSNARIVKTLEDKARESSTPAGDYFFDIKLGKIRLRKSETGRISWQIDGEQITRPILYRTTKDMDKAAAPAPEKGKGKKEKAKTEDGPTTDETSKVYKKKQLLNVLKKGQMFRKRVIKAIAELIPEKKLTGASFLAAIDDATGETTSTETANQIFQALK